MKEKWVVLLLLCVTRSAVVQYAVPMYAPPVPIVVPVAVQLPHFTTTSTTTTTTQRSIAVAVPLPVPMPVQFAVPGYPAPHFCGAKPRPPNCPPCPPCLCLPSCTPSFFSYCSPCHLKCRCRNPNEAPVPLPPNPPAPVIGPAYAMPVPAPSSVVVVPFPPVVRPPWRPDNNRKRRPYYSSDTDTISDTSSDCSTDTESDSDSDYFFKRSKNRKRKRRRWKHIASRLRMARRSDSEVVKPVLSYVSKTGDVKFKTKISNSEAAHLLGEKKQVAPQSELENKPQVVVVSRNTGHALNGRRMKQYVMESGSPNRVLREGAKEMIFRSPANKQISNLSVSFQIS